MDIGCGDELPLTRLAIKHAGAKKVHSIEVNPETHSEAKQSIKRFGIEDTSGQAPAKRGQDEKMAEH